jgi:hypothetical protein
MGRVEKTVFISYRRRDEPWALAVFADLTQHGFDVFVDYERIASGNFETVILENIRARAHFLVLLTPTALENDDDPDDWLRREIEAALDSQRNIVPLMLSGFNFRTAVANGQLKGKLGALSKYNGLQIPEGYFPQAMEKLRNRFLNVAVDAVLHPASDSAKLVATEQSQRAKVALEVAATTDKGATIAPSAGRGRPRSVRLFAGLTVMGLVAAIGITIEVQGVETICKTCTSLSGTEVQLGKRFSEDNLSSDFIGH